MRALLVGNGPSRLAWDLEDLRPQFDVVGGCNALYRDFTPDVLVAVDPPIMNEIAQASPDCRFIHSTRNQRDKKYMIDTDRKPICLDRGFGSGPTLGMVLYGLYHPEEVVMIGIDLMRSIPDGSNNVYVNTPNYRKEWQTSPGDKREIEDWAKVFELRKDTLWTWVSPHWDRPPQWGHLTHVRHKIDV